MNKEKVVAKDEGIKTYDEKVSDYKEHFDDIGLHDPSTEAAIQQMETATSREKATGEAHELIERREVRDAHNLETDGERSVVNFPSEQKAKNEALSEVLQDRQDADVERTEDEVAKEIKPVAKKDLNKK